MAPTGSLEPVEAVRTAGFVNKNKPVFPATGDLCGDGVHTAAGVCGLDINKSIPEEA